MRHNWEATTTFLVVSNAGMISMIALIYSHLIGFENLEALDFGTDRKRDPKAGRLVQLKAKSLTLCFSEKLGHSAFCTHPICTLGS